ncbi:3-dehydroquinate synthase [Pectinatus sottacetonis]|uniref:3-dehydroquinate synthase n=1 Tax=Pectinatus sottacetonis TaxID=1002795 RepID=UPI0018C5CC2C|nr:3-dehydroquinate synthase [Pectinatus sottacetonis]
MKNVRVDLKENSYDIWIGNNLDEKIKQFFTEAGFSRRVFIISDTNVGPLYKNDIIKLLQAVGYSVSVELIKAGEPSKSWDTAQLLYTKVIEAGLDRNSPIIALGGGVVGDIAGFIAATYMRGVPFIQMPTSLLAHVDSSVGGKVAINHPMGKNLIGAFYQPKAVFIDLDMLKTLPPREISAGLAEIIKYGLIYDKEFFSYIEKNSSMVFRFNNEVLQNIIARSCEIKASVVSKDERENGLRAILNFGHTLGHAVERETQYKKYNHGEAIAIGMMGAVFISVELGLIDKSLIEILRQILAECNLPQKADACDKEKLYKDLFHDKKTVDGKIKWVLLDRIGQVHLDNNVAEKIVKKAIDFIIK